jgi:hypothetical protein
MATGLLAQVLTTSTIVGSVTDPQGAMVAGAKVTLKNIGTGVEWKTTTDGAGNYQFPYLIAGEYTVEVVKEGFAQSVSTAVALPNGTTQRINLGLKMGQTLQTVEVTTAASLVKTDDANVSEVIENKFVRDLPVEGRNYLNFAQILPSFNSGTGDTGRLDYGLASSTMPGGKQLNVGGTEYGVGYYIDGLDNNDNWVEGPVMNVNQDTIQEVKAEVSNYSAEYGRDVGQISVTTKSGTNVLHGSVFETWQNSGLNANNPYSNYQGLSRDSFHQNQYGFTVGGPVYIPKVFNGKNKLFFFGSFERLRNTGVSPYTTYVPTLAERGDGTPSHPGGDFSAWPYQTDPRFVIYDPASYVYDPADPNYGHRTAFPGNIIPPDKLSANALAYLSHFPMPNGYVSPDPSFFDNYSGTYTNGINNDNYTVRADYNLSSRDFIYFRYSHDHGSRTQSGGLVPEVALPSVPVHTTKTYQAHYVRAISSNFSNEFNVSWTRAQNNYGDPGQGNRWNKSWIQDLFQNASSNLAGFTSYDKSHLGVSNDGTFGVDFNTDYAGPGNINNINFIGKGLSLGTDEFFYQAIPIFQLSDNVSKTIKRHNLKAGFSMARRYERDNDIIRYVQFMGNYTSSQLNAGDGSGNGIADFLTGYVSQMKQRAPVASGDASLYFGLPEYGAYLNDSWNATQKLTVNLGLRYDLPIPAYSVNNYWGVLDESYPGWRLYMPGLTPGTSSHPFSAPKKDFAPRIGLAYRLGEKTVVRSGYGIFYETGRYKFMDQMFFNSPGYGGVIYDSGTQQGDSGRTLYTIDGPDPATRTFPAISTSVRGTWPNPLGEFGGTVSSDDTAGIDRKSWVTPYDQRWSLDVQRELSKTMVATLGYVGARGVHLPIQYDLNLPPQGVYLDDNTDFLAARPLTSIVAGRWKAINSVRENRSNNYHAMNAELKIRGWHGLTSQVSYTWSKQMDNFFGQSGESGTHAIGGQWHPEWSYGPSDANHTHRLVFAFAYELPGRTLGNRIMREVIGGWQINSIATFESGSPTTVYNGSGTSSYDRMGDVPDRTCNGNLARGTRTFTRHFNTDCYVEPAATTVIINGQEVDNFAAHRGNEGRNNLVQPGINNWDMGLQKSVKLFGEGRELQFRADAFNVFNHTQWSSVSTYDDRIINPTSNFGSITGGRSGRHMQLNFRFVF